MKAPPTPLSERIERRTRRDGPVPAGLDSPCWVWTGSRDIDGYGQMSVRGKTRQAHIASYEHYRGPVPAGLELDHRCSNRPCVNPAHLEAVTHEVNVQRAAARARAAREAEAAQALPWLSLITPDTSFAGMWLDLAVFSQPREAA